MPKNPISHPRTVPLKNIIEGTAASHFFARKVWNNYKPRIRGRAFLEASFFRRVPFAAPALIFEPIKLRQERAHRSGESKDSIHWANTGIGGSDQNLIKLVWCLGGCALVTGGIQSGKQNEAGVFLLQSDCLRAADLFNKRRTHSAAHRNGYRVRKHLHIVHCDTANSPCNMLKVKQALFPPARSGAPLPFPPTVALATQVYFYARGNVSWFDEFLLCSFLDGKLWDKSCFRCYLMSLLQNQ